MCYNISYLEKRGAKYAERYKDVLPENLTDPIKQTELPFYYFVSGFSHPQLPVVKQDGIFLFEWGLIPFWAKNADAAKEIQSKTLNAVGETVFEKPSFKNSINSKRCLLAVSGFYEWRDYNKAKYPYFIHLRSNEIFSLGCIYETWVDKSTGEIKNTFSILTTRANGLMEKIHNLKKRMPLILSKADERKWLAPDLTPADINQLIKPYDESDMVAYTVSKFVNSPSHHRNIPEAIEKFEYPELSVL